MKKAFGPQYDLADLGEVEEPKATTLGVVFRPPHRRRTLFVAVFWTAQVIPLFAVYTFAPRLLEAFGMTGDANLYGGSLIIAGLFVVGGLPGLWLVERIGRRALLAWSFALIAAALVVPALIPQVPAAVFLAALAVFALVSGASNFLEVVYPNELFPTEVRATAVGVGTALSRIGSAVGTYLMPFALAASGATGALLIGAAVSVVGLLATLAWAPETRGRSLIDASTATPRPDRSASAATSDDATTTTAGPVASPAPGNSARATDGTAERQAFTGSPRTK